MHQFVYPGDPSPAQRWLRITELHFNPPPQPAGAVPSEDHEFIELRNLSTTETLDLAGVRLVDGVEFDFGSGAIRRLEPGRRLVVVANPTVFTARHGASVPVAGQYLGRLDNGGERVRLLDARGEEVLDFEYRDWFPAADGGGFAMEVVDEQAAPDTWGDKAQWRAGSSLGGTPGTGGPDDGLRLGAQVSAGGLVLRFPAAANRRYTLQASGTLEAGGAWTPILEVPARPGPGPVEHLEALTGGQRFFRVVSNPAP
jgi:hypothetical protein